MNHRGAEREVKYGDAEHVRARRAEQRSARKLKPALGDLPRGRVPGIISHPRDRDSFMEMRASQLCA